ncbi:MAG: nitroreductase family protein [Clostridiales bacterium]|nr:nitroreductase family protein [Candidatus Blautia equi]
MANYENERREILAQANNTVKELLERKSVRAFLDKEISPEEKRQILYAAADAPSAGCQQLYTILDITDQELKNKLAVTCDNQPFIAKASMVLVFCSDCRKWYEAFQSAGCEPRNPGAGDLLLAVTDTAIAAQNAVTAAWSLGIGSCYIGDIMENCEEQQKLLNLPKYVVPTVMAVFGYPTEQQKNRTKPVRFNMEDIVFENGYKERTPEDYRNMFDIRRGSQSYEEWMEKFCNRKFNSDFSREMTRSVEEYLKQFR